MLKKISSDISILFLCPRLVCCDITLYFVGMPVHASFIRFSGTVLVLILNTPTVTAAGFFFFFSEKIRLNISCGSSARQRIHMKHQALFSKEKSEKKTNKSVSAAM